MVEKTKEKSEKQLEAKLPISLSQGEDVLKLFRGYNIGICEEQIVAMDLSLRNLIKKLEEIIPKGKRCIIEYLDEGASVYGFSIS